MALTQEQVLAKVREVLIDALGVDEEEVTPEAKLVADLGAESIDFLDIVFRLEKAFGIKINQSDLFPDNVLNNPEYVKDGKVTETGVAELRKKMPHVNLDAFAADPQVDEFSNIFTVDTLVKFVLSKTA